MPRPCFISSSQVATEVISSTRALHVPDEGLPRDVVGLLLRRRAVHHGEGGRLGVHACGRRASCSAGAPRGRGRSGASTSSGGERHAERAEAEAELAHHRWPSSLPVAPKIGGCGRLQRLRQHAPARHRPVACRRTRARRSSSSRRCGSTASFHMARVSSGWMPKPSISRRVARAAGAEVDAAVGEQVEHRGRLGRAHGVVVRLRREPHAVADAQLLRARGDGAVEHLGVRAVASTPRGSGARPSRSAWKPILSPSTACSSVFL